MDEAIGAGSGHQLKNSQVLWGKFHAPWIDRGSVLVVSTETGVGVEITASNVSVMKLTGVFIFEFDQTAAPASVTEGLPLVKR